MIYCLLAWLCVCFLFHQAEKKKVQHATTKEFAGNFQNQRKEVRRAA